MAMTYEEAARRLGRRVSVQVDKVRGTEIRRAPGESGERGDIQVRYRGTPVVTLHPDHSYTLRTGGTYSKTVIRRIGEYSPARLTRERNGIYMQQDGDKGRWIPFLEGVKVDQNGHTVAGVPLVKITREEGNGHSKRVFADEEQLTAFVRQVVIETLGDMAIAPGRSLPGGGRAPKGTSDGRRTVDVKVTASRMEPSTMIPLDVVEKLFQSQLPPDKAKRAIADLTSAYARGRKPRAAADEGEAPTMAEAAKCADCKEPLVNHYDRANRYRGCEYALKHLGEPAELV